MFPLLLKQVHSTEECPKRLMVCQQGCGGQYRADELEQHMRNECEGRRVECKYCKEECTSNALQVHNIYTVETK